jgi:hypothetical protein
MGRRFSVRLSLRLASWSLPWRRTVIWPAAEVVGESVFVVPAVGAGRGGDPVDGDEPQLAKDLLVVHAPEGGVVDDALRSGGERRGAFEAGHGDGGLGSRSVDVVDVEDHAGALPFAARGDEDELGAPGGLAGAFEVQGSVRLEAQRVELAGCSVEALIAGLSLEQRGYMTLPSP